MTRAPLSARRIVATVVALGAMACPSPSHALRVTHALLRFGRRGGDSYQISGTTSGVSLDGAEHVVFALGERSVALAIADASRKKGRFRWRMPKGTGLLSQLRFDPKSGKFTATGSKLVLGGMPIPLLVRFGTDCTVTGLQVTTKKNRRGESSVWRLRDTGHRPTDACVFDGTPQVVPSVVAVGTATSVHVSARLRPGFADAQTRVSLFRVNPNGVPVADGTVCMLQDDGHGTYSCTATLTENHPGHVLLDVGASNAAGGAVSAGLTLSIASPLTLDDAQHVIDAQNALRAAWQANLATLGDTLHARLDTIAAVRDLPGVLSATLASDGLSITLELPGGVIHDLVLHPFEETTAPTIAPRARATSAVGPRSIVAGDACPDAASDRTPVRNARVLVWDVLSDPPDARLPPDTVPRSTGVRQGVEQMFGASVCPRFEVEAIEGPNTTVASVQRFGEFGTIVMLTHGLNDAEHGQRFLTGEGSPPDARGIYDMGKDFIAGRVSFFEYGLRASIRPNLAIRPGFFDAGLPANGVVYAGFCHSADNIAFAEAMAPGGTYFGFTNVVAESYVVGLVPRQLYPALVDEPLEPRLVEPAHQTTGEAYAGVTPKQFVTPVADGGGQLVVNDFVLAGGTDRLAYLGRPTLTPASPTIGPQETQTFAVTLDGSETCDLEYHWKNAAAHGRLDDPEDLSRQDDFQTPSKSAFYVASDPAVPGRDDLGVDFLALPKDGGDRRPVAHACGGVIVSDTTTTTSVTTSTSTTISPTCGNQLLDAGEQCDGDLRGDTCLGLGLPCRSDCTCTDGCTSSSQCGIASCCRVSVGVCCPWGGGPCPGNGGSPFGDGSGSCSNTPGNPPPEVPAVCGPSRPATCPAEAEVPVFYECTTCRDDQRYIAELYDTLTMEITPLQ